MRSMLSAMLLLLAAGCGTPPAPAPQEPRSLEKLSYFELAVLLELEERTVVFWEDLEKECYPQRANGEAGAASYKRAVAGRDKAEARCEVVRRQTSLAWERDKPKP